MKLDKKDRRILYELDFNARQPLSQIAKSVGLSKQAVVRRVRLLEEDVIQKYLAIVDLSRLGYTGYKVFMRFQNANPATEKKIFTHLAKHPRVQWLSGTDGEFDCVFNIFAKTPVELYDLLKAFENRFGEFIAERQLVILLLAQFYSRAYLVGKQIGESLKPMYFGSESEQVKLDAKDFELLGWLCQNARYSYAELSKKTSLSPDAVRWRTQRLEKANVIHNYVLVLNNEALGQLHYKVLLRLNPMTFEQETTLNTYWQTNPNIYFSSKAIGPWDAEFNAEVRDAFEFRRLLSDFKQHFSDVIRDYSTLSIYRVFKFDFYPMRFEP